MSLPEARKLVGGGILYAFLSGILGMVVACGPAQPPSRTSTVSIEQSRESVTDLSHAREVKKEHDSQLMAIPGVVGTGISRDAKGQPVIEVYVERLNESLRQKVPKELDGVSVRIVETGEFEARPKDPSPRQQ